MSADKNDDKIGSVGCLIAVCLSALAGSAAIIAGSTHSVAFAVGAPALFYVVTGTLALRDYVRRK